MAVKPLRLYSGSLKGLVNKFSASRIKFDDKTGIAELSLAYNIDLDASGRVTRRRGFTKKQNGSFHSLWAQDNIGLVVKSGYLNLINTDLLLVQLTAVRPEAKMSYAFVNRQIYFVNGYDKGVVVNGTFVPWVGLKVVGPTAYRVISDPPIGNKVMYYHGRMYIAVDNVLFYSQPFAYSHFVVATNFLTYAQRITMLHPVYGKNSWETEGFYIGLAGHGVYYIGGDSPKDFAQTQVTDDEAVEWTDVSVDGRFIGKEGVLGRVVMWTGQEGIWIGQHNAKADCVTMDSVVYPNAVRGAATFFNHKYFSLLEE